jgi:hypothetical protein
MDVSIVEVDGRRYRRHPVAAASAAVRLAPRGRPQRVYDGDDEPGCFAGPDASGAFGAGGRLGDLRGDGDADDVDGGDVVETLTVRAGKLTVAESTPPIAPPAGGGKRSPAATSAKPLSAGAAAFVPGGAAPPPAAAAPSPVDPRRPFSSHAVAFTEGGRSGWRASVFLPRSLFGVVIGRAGATIRGIQEEHGAAITLPRGEDDDAPTYATIAAPERDTVNRARARLLDVAYGSVRAPHTHFLCFRVDGAGPAFEDFKRQVLARHGAAIPAAAFVAAGQLHVAVAKLHLPTPAAVRVANTTLRMLSGELKLIAGLAAVAAAAPTAGGGGKRSGASPAAAAPPKGLPITLQGVEISGDDASAAHAVYARVAPSPGQKALEQMWLTVVQRFIAADLLPPCELARQRLLLPDGTLAPRLHVALLASALMPPAASGSSGRAAGGGGGGGAGGSDWERHGGLDADSGGALDCRSVVREWADRPIASGAGVHVSGVHLAIRGPWAADGFYRCEESVAL